MKRNVHVSRRVEVESSDVTALALERGRTLSHYEYLLNTHTQKLRFGAELTIWPHIHKAPKVKN